MLIPVHHSQEMEIAKVPEPEIIVHVQSSFFDHVYEKLRFEEGNYAWLTGDYGGETYGGITRNYAGNWPGWQYIDSAKIQENGKKVKALQWNQLVPAAEPHVKDFYHQWWKDWNMDIIKDSLAATYTFDFAICGTPSIKVLQRCLNDFGYNFKVNGRMTMQMAEAINELDPVIFTESLRIDRRNFYITISQKYHKVRDRWGKVQYDSLGQPIWAQTQKRFLDGWLVRADRVKPIIRRRLEQRKKESTPA